MLVTFRSKASADLIMFGDPAKEIIAILGKDPGDVQGIVTVEQLPDAIARLRKAIQADKAQQAALAAAEEESDAEQSPVGMAAPVGFAQRAWPLLEMLECASKEGYPVVWGA